MFSGQLSILKTLYQHILPPKTPMALLLHKAIDYLCVFLSGLAPFI
jgi:hypothetical protein